MQIDIQSIHFNADQKLITFVEEKLNKIAHIYENIEGAEVYLKLDSSPESNKVAEIKLLVPGDNLFAKKQCKSFEEAVDSAIDALIKQAKKHKEKIG